MDNKIAFLNVLVTQKDDGSMSTQIFQKPSNTNIIICPNSCHDPKIHAAIFKGEVCRATRLCMSPTQSKKEIEFAFNMYEDNGHCRKDLGKIAATYDPLQKQHQQQQRPLQ
jgi:hypothetical protein